MFCFPEVEEIQLRNSPIAEVICQVRFPAVLRISRDVPVDFQELIRDDFPETESAHEMNIQVSKSDPGQLAVKPSPPVFRFRSGDGATTVSLSSSFYALSTSRYTHWREFMAKLEKVHASACEIYKLPYAARIGLRYVNRLTHDNTKTSTAEDLWSILRPELTTLLRVDCWSPPEEMLNQVALAEENGTKLTLRSGYKIEEDAGPVFVLDFDSYVEGHTPLNTVLELVNGFHDVIYKAFRWCIAEGSLEAFDPEQEQG